LGRVGGGCYHLHLKKEWRKKGNQKGGFTKGRREIRKTWKKASVNIWRA